MGRMLANLYRCSATTSLMEKYVLFLNCFYKEWSSKDIAFVVA